MTPLGTIPDIPATRRESLEAVSALAKQLRGLKQVVVAGAAADTNIAVAGIATDDVIVSAFEIPANGAIVSRTGTTTIHSAGNIRCSASTAGNQILLTYIDIA